MQNIRAIDMLRWLYSDAKLSENAKSLAASAICAWQITKPGEQILVQRMCEKVFSKRIIAKRCSCGINYTHDEFIALPLPHSGKGEGNGLIWRNCKCKSTIAIECERSAMSQSI